MPFASQRHRPPLSGQQRPDGARLVVPERGAGQARQWPAPRTPVAHPLGRTMGTTHSRLPTRRPPAGRSGEPNRIRHDNRVTYRAVRCIGEIGVGCW